MLFRTSALVILGLTLAACSGDGSEPKDASDVADESGTETTESGAEAQSDSAEGDSAEGEGEQEEPETASIPKKCASKKDDICLPDKKFVKKICNGDYQTVALKLFSDGTPWKRGYLTHETNAWNASGGGSSNEKLAIDEEVLVIRYRAPNSNEDGIQVSGANGGYDALRWDGMCVTLDASELRFDPPPNPKNARLVWTRIEMDTRDALKKDDVVRKAYIKYKKACRGVTVGRVSKKCVKLDGELSGIIANYVRESGSALPKPHKLPE
jgi:hypothetical protein